MFIARAGSILVHDTFYGQGAFRLHPAASRTGPRSGRCRAGRAHARPAGRDGDGARRGHACRLPRRDQGRRRRRGRDLELSLDRIGRGIRHALALKPHFARRHRETAHKAAAEARAPIEEKARRRRQVARDRLQLDRHRPQFRHCERALLATTAMWGRLVEKADIDAALAFADHPIEEIILRLCRDMDIQPEFILMADPDATAQAPAKDDSANDEHGLRFWPRTGRDYARYCASIHQGRPVYWFDNDTRTRLDGTPWWKNRTKTTTTGGRARRSWSKRRTAVDRRRVAHACSFPARPAFHSPPPLAGGGWGEGLRASARVSASSKPRHPRESGDLVTPSGERFPLSRE